MSALTGPSLSTIYVTGHRNPDTDSIASALGYAELKQRLNPGEIYQAVRLGDVNSQTAWALTKAGIDAPEFLPHIMLRACDVMTRELITANHGDSLRDVGLAMAKADLDLMPIVDDDGRVAGMMTTRDLARRYVKESGEPSSFADRPASIDLIVDVLGGELLVRPERKLNGRLWAVTVRTESMGGTMGANDIAVIGDRTDAQRGAIEIGVALLVIPYGLRPDADIIALAQEKGTGVVMSPLDSYVTGRLVSLSVPVGEVMTREPLLAEPDDLLSEVSDRITDVHYNAAIIIDDDRRPIGIVTRTDMLNPAPRHVLLVDHGEQAQSVLGVEQAHIVEILDHHHIGSIETKFPVAATFDPVGSTATLVIERFRSHGREPQRPTATMLLAAVLSDTVILSSPTTTERDHHVVAYLEELLGVDAHEFGTEMFEASSDVGGVPAADIIRRDAKEYEVRAGRKICIAQIETVGRRGLAARRDELLAAMDETRVRMGYQVMALMITDIVAKETRMLISGDSATVERAFGDPVRDGVIDLPGVMSRKKQVAPTVLAAMQ